MAYFCNRSQWSDGSLGHATDAQCRSDYRKQVSVLLNAECGQWGAGWFDYNIQYGDTDEIATYGYQSACNACDKVFCGITV